MAPPRLSAASPSASSQPVLIRLDWWSKSLAGTLLGFTPGLGYGNPGEQPLSLAWQRTRDAPER